MRKEYAMADNDYKEILASSLEKIKAFAETDTAIGEPICLPSGMTLLPISKISMGLATGGLGFGGKKESSHTVGKNRNFTAGGGSGISITPIAFLIIGKDGITCDLLSIKDPSDSDSVEKITALIEKSPGIIQKLKNVVFEKQRNHDV